MIPETFLVGLSFDFIPVFQKVLDISVGLDQFPGAFFSDSRRSGDIVCGVSPQSQQVRHLVGLDAQLLFNLLCIQNCIVLHRIEHEDILGNQLQHVLVAGYNDRLKSVFGRL